MKSVIATLFASLLVVGAPITGTLNLTGDASIRVGGANFLCDLGSPCTGTNGAFFITGPIAQSGDFVPLAGTFGQIADVDATTDAPINTPFLLPNFLTFNANPDIKFDLTFLFKGSGGSCPPAPGSVCTPTSPILVNPLNPLGTAAANWQDTITGSTASISGLAIAVRNSTGETTPYRAVLTAQFTAPTAVILGQINGGGSVNTSYSATLSPFIIPEPKTYVLLGSSLLLLSFIKRSHKV